MLPLLPGDDREVRDDRLRVERELRQQLLVDRNDLLVVPRQGPEPIDDDAGSDGPRVFPRRWRRREPLLLHYG